MKMNSLAAKFALAVALCTPMVMAPANAEAQSRKNAAQHRQQTKNEWRNIAIGSGALALIGLIEKNGTLTTIGTVGALYAASRYEHDRKSQNKLERQRASLYSKRYISYKGKKYERRLVTKNGKKYYQFVRC